MIDRPQWGVLYYCYRYFRRDDDSVEEKYLQQILGKLDNLEQGQTTIVTRLDNLEQGQTGILARLDNLEQGQASLEQGQASLEQGQASLEQGQTGILARLDNLEQGFTELGQSMRKLNQNVTVIENDLTRKVNIIYENIVDINKRNQKIDHIESEVAEHHDRIWALEQVVKAGHRAKAN